MLKIKRGDICKAEEAMICHGANAQGVAGAGVALALRTAFPAAFEPYFATRQKRALVLGEIIVGEDHGKHIVHCVTQQNYGRRGRFVDYDAVGTAMRRVAKLAHQFGIDAVAMPKIGAGLGGGDWQTIQDIIEGNVDVKVTVYTL